MIGNVSIDLSLSNIWRSWYRFRRGKKPTADIDRFSYYLEENLASLHADLTSGNYRHGEYRSFTVMENKKRDISVAGIRDRVVHRLLYDYLNEIYDKTFIFDVWSCRKKKGLVKAIDRAEEFLRENSESFVWRADIKKFFDNVSHRKLLEILAQKIQDDATFALLKKIIESYSVNENRGIPIGNLTSQIFFKYLS
jgi:retron-type reverse transcriptase